MRFRVRRGDGCCAFAGMHAQASQRARTNTNVLTGSVKQDPLAQDSRPRPR